jgi:hypothetical protein
MNDNPFYSMDRLLQFGMEVGVAQQMMRSMNTAMQNTTIPGPQTAPLGMSAQMYWLVLDAKQAGPFTEGKVNKDTLAWRNGLPAWQKAGDTPDLVRLVALAPPPLPGAAP